MRWAQASIERPPKDGQWYVWHPRLGKCVMGYVDGSWGAQPPLFWLENDGSPHQGIDGSFVA